MVERSQSTSRLLSTTALKHRALSTSKHWRAWPVFEKLSPTLVKGFCLNSSDSYRPKYWKIKQVFMTYLSEVHLSFAANSFSLQNIRPYYRNDFLESNLNPWQQLKLIWVQVYRKILISSEVQSFYYDIVTSDVVCDISTPYSVLLQLLIED